MKDLYTENGETLIKETEEYISQWKDILGSWIGRIMLIHTTQSSLQSECNPDQNSSGVFFHRNSTNNPKIYMEA